MADNVLLLGGTDVTLAVAEAVIATGAHLRAIVTVGEHFSISYSPTKIANSRSIDLSAWGSQHGVEIVRFFGYDEILVELGDLPDLCLVGGWYHMIPRRFRAMFPRGCLGFHASLLPQLRGGAPLNWAILSAMRETGVTLFSMGDGVDDGLIFGQQRFPIGPRTTIQELVTLSREACAALTRELLPGLLAGMAFGRAQTGPASYGLQRSTGDGRIDWSESAADIDRLVRAVGRPYPGAFTALEGEIVRIWASQIGPELRILGAPGQIARVPELDQPCVVTGDGVLVVTEATGGQGNDMLDKLRHSGHKRFDS